jgi:hypothetical protein
MRHPTFLQRAIGHPLGERIGRRSAPSPLPPEFACPAPADLGGDGRGHRWEARTFLVPAAWLAAASGAMCVITGFHAAPEFFTVSVLLAVAGTVVGRRRGTARALAALVGVLLLPALLAIGLAVRLTSRGPVLVRQGIHRRGRAPALRFRTTVTAAGSESRTASDPRPTPLGRVLRHLGLDELPRLIDVVRGEMSVHGAGRS